MNKPIFISLSFYPIRAKEVDFLKSRHRTDKAIYKDLERDFRVIFVGHRRPDALLRSTEKAKYFLYRHLFFTVPLRTLLYVRKQKPAAILIHSFNYPFQSWLLRRLLPRATRVFFQHHAEQPFSHPLKRWIQELGCRSATGYFFASDGLADLFRRRQIIKGSGRVTELMEISSALEPVAQEEGRRWLELPLGTMLLWVGRLNNNKDPLTVLRAFRMAIKNGRAITLYMIFSTTELFDEIKGFIEQEQLQQWVRLVGPVTHERLVYWYSAADYFVAASRYEGSGVALCEAMGCGCVPLLSDIPSFRTMTRNGYCGFLYPPGDHERLAALMMDIEPARTASLSEKAMQVFREDLSVEAISRKLHQAVIAKDT